MASVWSANTPRAFWQCQPDPSPERWQDAIQQAVPLLGLPVQADDVDTILEFVLGEGQFGPERWRLSAAKRLYYALKPALPRRFTQVLRRLHGSAASGAFPLGWPIEERYVRFQWEVMRSVLNGAGKRTLAFKPFWPDGHRFAFVLTHDVERSDGQAYVRAVADLDEHHGFRSSFKFVPESYPAVSDRAVRGATLYASSGPHAGHRPGGEYATALDAQGGFYRALLWDGFGHHPSGLSEGWHDLGGLCPVPARDEGERRLLACTPPRCRPVVAKACRRLKRR
jgi:hypothetical protein